MAFRCIICLITMSSTPYRLCYRAEYYNQLHNNDHCTNFICVQCSFYCGMNIYEHIHPIFKYREHKVPFCCNACAITFYTMPANPINQWILNKNNPLLISQYNIHISILSHKYLNNYIINDLINVVIEYLVE